MDLARLNDTPVQDRTITQCSASLSNAKRVASDAAERACLEQGLQEVGGTVAELARRWEMNRSHLQVLLKKHGIRAGDYKQQWETQNTRISERHRPS